MSIGEVIQELQQGIEQLGRGEAASYQLGQEIEGLPAALGDGHEVLQMVLARLRALDDLEPAARVARDEYLEGARTIHGAMRGTVDSEKEATSVRAWALFNDDDRKSLFRTAHSLKRQAEIAEEHLRIAASIIGTMASSAASLVEKNEKVMQESAAIREGAEAAQQM